MRALCWIGLHNWGLWGIYIRGPWENAYGRTCRRCGWEDIR